MTTTTRPRAQEDRSATTRRRVLDATIDCLLELGYAGTSTTAIQRRAGVSRGALTHQFHSKQELLIAAARHLSDVRSTRIAEALQRIPPGSDRLRTGLRLAWAEYDGPLFQVALELWTASRTDDALQQALYSAEREIGRQQRSLFVPLVHSGEPDHLTREEVDILARFMRGTALTDVLTRSSSDPGQVVDQCLRLIGR